LLLFDEDDPRQVIMILLEEIAKVCSGKESGSLTIKMMDNLNGDQLQTIVKSRINIIDPIPSPNIELPFQTWLKKIMAH
jgi:Tfp pilus assembly PilM family ATPase